MIKYCSATPQPNVPRGIDNPLRPRRYAVRAFLGRADIAGEGDQPAIGAYLPADVQGAWDVNKHEIWVYTIEDLQKALLTLHEAASVLFYYRFYMRPLRVNQLDGAPPDIQELGTVTAHSID